MSQVDWLRAPTRIGSCGACARGVQTLHRVPTPDGERHRCSHCCRKLFGNPTSPPPAVGPEELRQRRERIGLSQNGLADRLGVAQSTVTRWESGARVIEHAPMLDLALRALEAERVAAGD